MARFFKETSVSLNFARGQQLTTYAYEISKVMKEKAIGLNFVHITKQEFSGNARSYYTCPRYVSF